MNATRILSIAIACSTTLVCGGCGLADYEKKMVEEQKKQDIFDEQERHLGEPMELTATTVGDPSTPVDIFLRMPKGNATSPSEKWHGIFNRYDRVAPPRVRYGMLPPPESPFSEVYVAVAPPGDLKEFADKAQQGLAGYTGTKITEVVKSSPGRAPLKFHTITYSDSAPAPTSYVVFLHQMPQGVRIAIVFHTMKDKAERSEVTKTIDLCLQTLAFGADAAKARGAVQTKISVVRKISVFSNQPLDTVDPIGETRRGTTSYG